MPWKKASAELIKLLEESMVNFRCDRKMMFGSPTFFVNNNMFAGVHQDTIIMRLSEQDRQEIQSRYDEAAPFEPMAGHIMKEYVALPESLSGNNDMLQEWLNRSYEYALSLPPKEPKRPRKKKQAG